MPAKSKQQQKFFGVVKAMKDGDIPKKGRAGEIADNMTKKEIDKYASTKHKGLPKKVKEQFKLFTFEDFVNEMQVTLNPGMNVPGMGQVVAPGVGDGSVGSGDRMDMGPKKKKKKDEEEELETLDISVAEAEVISELNWMQTFPTAKKFLSPIAKKHGGVLVKPKFQGKQIYTSDGVYYKFEIPNYKDASVSKKNSEKVKKQAQKALKAMINKGYVYNHELDDEHPGNDKKGAWYLFIRMASDSNFQG